MVGGTVSALLGNFSHSLGCVAKEKYILHHLLIEIYVIGVTTKAIAERYWKENYFLSILIEILD
jgi:hypothetical protein